jgi:transcriptional regulator with GAF, ATPase, and Fis domain
MNRVTRIGALATADPDTARKEILTAFRRARADAATAAKVLGISRRQFDRLVRRLALVEEIFETRKSRRKVA